MPRVTYVDNAGTEREIDVESGITVMEGAVSNGVPGIDADCGGACSCATCHVYVRSEPEGALPPISEMEAEMLEFVAAERRESSRLSCRLTVDESYDGLIVETPETQS